uniref:Uncharacterized protein n=1 Tax=Physcomitrium patens TaxID=3218 RepID=A0A2K1IET7_PHYPA|nr:hypothetical protein PHYPA_029941 [Physcomitrium patens]
MFNSGADAVCDFGMAKLYSSPERLNPITLVARFELASHSVCIRNHKTQILISPESVSQSIACLANALIDVQSIE